MSTRRRRGSRGAWLPILPSTYESSDEVTFYSASLTIPNPASAGDTTIAVTPLTYDDSDEIDETGAVATLKDRVEGQDYLLKRVVGKVWMDTSFLSDEGSVISGIGCIALAVLPTDDTGVPSIPAEEYNPLFTRNSMQPWLWRRTWRLSRPDAAANGDWPATTSAYGSVAEGGHIDTKGTVRRITKEHRIFMIAAWGNIQVIEGSPVANTIRWGCDVRMFGSMKRAMNRSSF